MKEHDIWGWSRHVTDGEVISAATVADQDGDALALVVRRTIAGRTRYFLERLAPVWADSQPIAEACFVDCGLGIRTDTPTSTVEGLGPSGRLRAFRTGGRQPCGGLRGAWWTHRAALRGLCGAGRPAVCIRALPPAGGRRLQFRHNTGARAGLRFLLAPPVPQRRRAIRPQPQRTLRPALYAGTLGRGRAALFWRYHLCAPSGGWDNQTSIWLVQQRPLPFRVLALTLDITFA